MSMVERPSELWLRVAGFCGILGPVIALAGIFLSIEQSPWFNWSINALSDLGVSSVVAPIFRSSLILSGMLSVILALGLIESLRKLLGKIGATSLVLGGISLTAIGVFPSGQLHAYSTVAFFAFEPLSFSLIGVSLILETRTPEKYLGLVTIILAILAVLVWVVWFQGRKPLVGMAIPEFQSALAFSCWSIIFGTRLFIAHASSTH